jgi:hypothetical protein
VGRINGVEETIERRKAEFEVQMERDKEIAREESGASMYPSAISRKYRILSMCGRAISCNVLAVLQYDVCKYGSVSRPEETTIYTYLRKT